jgi:hemerythrin superfamily protein
MPASITEAEKVEERSLMDLLTSFYQDLYDYDLKEEPDIYETVQKICQEVEAQ